MNLRRVRAIFVHAWYHLSHSVETWVDVFWFPIINTLIFGLVALYFSRGGAANQSSIILLGILLWQIIEMGCYSIAVGALWEVWSQSFSSLFVSPLRLREYVLGQILFGLIKQTGVFLILSTVAFVAFKFWIWQIGWMLPIYALLLAVFSWSFGMFVLGLILRFGTSIQSLSWGLIYMIQPLVAVYFPVTIVPSQLRWISFLLPPTYVFESARRQWLTGAIDQSSLLVALGLDVVYLVVSGLFLGYMWGQAKQTGVIVRMEQ